MKLATYRVGSGPALLGYINIEAATVVDVLAVAREAGNDPTDTAFTSMLALIDAGPEALERLHDLVATVGRRDRRLSALSDVTLLAPIPEPRQLRDFAGFRQHLIDGPYGLLKLQARERGEPTPPRPTALAPSIEKFPLFYFGNRLNVVGHNAAIPWPRDSRFLDFEVEIGACIGRTAKNIAREDAAAHIFGYTIFNDISARDVQGEQMPGGLGPCKAKSFDGGNVLGPWIVTTDELPSPYGGTARVRVNGETWAEQPITGTVHDFAAMIEFASRDETIHAGEVFGSGTVSGCCGLEMDRWIRPGDVVELEVEGIGILRNRYG